MLTGLILSELRASPPEWRTETTADGAVEVKSRISELEAGASRGGVKVEFIATTTAPAGLAGLVSILKDASRHKDFLDEAETRTVATRSDSEWVLYYYSDNPWPFPDNDCVNRMRYSGSAGPARATFTLSAAPDLIPRSKVERLSVHEMKYDLEETGDGRTRITLTAAVVPAFQVPAWLIRKNFPDGPAQVLRKLARLAAVAPAAGRLEASQAGRGDAPESSRGGEP
jgi:hypothetical protein